MKKRIPPLLFFLAFLVVTLFASVDRDLIIAVAKNRFKKVVELIEKKKASVNATYDRGKTPLHWAVTGADLKMTAYLIARGARVDARDEYGDTPLHKASLKKDVDLDIIKYLVLKGANVNAVNRYGWTPLHSFTYNENSLVVKYLIMQEADLTNTTTRKYNEITNGMTALDIAVMKNYSNIIEALLSPDRYRHLSKTPFLTLSVSNELGSDGVLIAPEKGWLRLTVENRGGASASLITLFIEPVTNCDGLVFGNVDTFSLGVGQSREVVLPLEAARTVKDTIAFFRITAREYSYGKESNPVPLRIRTYPPRPPSLVLKPEWSAENIPVIRGLEKIRLPFLIENTNPYGYAEAVILRGYPVSNGPPVVIDPLSNIALPPLTKKSVEIVAEGGEIAADGTVKIVFTAEDTNFRVASTNRAVLGTRRLLRPFLWAEAFYHSTVLTNWATNFQTRFNVLTNLQITTQVQANFITNPVTNLSFSTNYFWQTNLAVRVSTNRESGFKLYNTGEGAARNVSVAIQAFLPPDPASSNTNELRTSVYAFTVPEIATNTARVVTYGQFIVSTNTNVNRVFLRVMDERKLSTVETNFWFELK